MDSSAYDVILDIDGPCYNSDSINADKIEIGIGTMKISIENFYQSMP
tara:strand:+ start:124 stop:264 length:141 start_codon:yes stop_codon:yes gene_type:complete